MEQLCYETLEKAGYTGYLLKNAPERVLQFGEGNFLRAFADYWFDMANEKAGWNGKCVLVQPIAQGLTQLINRQEGLYTLYLRGRQNGEKVDAKRVVSSVSRCLNPYEKQDYDAMMDVAAGEALEYIVSNTTEAGIVYDPSCRLEDCPPASFPAKLTQVLLHRWRAGRPGVVVLSCELIDNNGKELLRCVNQYIKQWGLEEGFARWVNGDCTFCSTLVDRIVPGRIRDAAEAARLEDENGYRDALIDVGVVPDVTPYKKRKVRILNGAHTGFVLGAYLAGYDIVRDCMQDDVILGFMNRMLHEEVIPTLPLDRQDLEAFAAAVQDRFNNPFINHELMSITLNSTSKWRARNMPSLLEYAQTAGKLPPCLAMSFAAYIAFYSSDIQALTEQGLVCRRPKGNEYTVSDDRWVLEFYYSRRGVSDETLVHDVMTNEKMWGQDLTLVPGFEQAAAENLRRIRTEGARAAFAACLARPAV